AVPSVGQSAPYKSVLAEIDQKKLGFTCVLNDDGQLVGIITDGDLRRALVHFGLQIFEKSAREVMTANPKTIAGSSLAAEALKMMEKYAISDLLIVDADNRPAGLIHLKDLLKAGII
ncbi:MAG TPA: CBS domain-containing protein, partial [Chroococcales cyanobacterium]